MIPETDWIDHNGEGMPVERTKIVEVRFREANDHEKGSVWYDEEKNCAVDAAGKLEKFWLWGRPKVSPDGDGLDIVAYRLTGDPDAHIVNSHMARHRT